MSPRFTRLAGLALTAGLFVGVASPASAQDVESDAPATDTADQRSPEQLAERCQQQIERRLIDLAAAQTRVHGIDAVTDAHAATIDGIIDSTEAGLRAQSAAIDDATDRETLVALCRGIATDFRVYLVVLPQTHLTVAADRADVALARADELVATFDEAAARAEEAGADVSDAVALRDEAVEHLAVADRAVDGTADAVLAVTPASYNDGSGATVLNQARTDLRTAQTELKEAGKDGKAALQALREAIGDLSDDV